MKIILGQGNPGTEYEKSRHNIGFMVLDFYADNLEVEFHVKPRFNSLVAEVVADEEKVLLVKPQTYYNETGQSARAVSDFYKVKISDILVIHDDLALPFGTLRTREKGSDAGNKGIRSLNTHLGENYARLRVGIWNELADSIDTSNFVLSRFTAAEADKLQSTVLPKASKLIADFTVGKHTDTSFRL